MELFAINQIDRGSKADPRIIPPGSVINLERNKVVDELIAIHAMRAATPEEVKIAKALDTYLIDVPIESEPKPSTTEPSAERADLEARAVAAGVEFSARIGDAKLLERVQEAEGKKPADTTTAPLV